MKVKPAMIETITKCGTCMVDLELHHGTHAVHPTQVINTFTYTHKTIILVLFFVSYFSIITSCKRYKKILRVSICNQSKMYYCLCLFK